MDGNMDMACRVKNKVTVTNAICYIIMHSDNKRKVRQVLEKQMKKSFQNTFYQKVKNSRDIRD